MCPDASEGRKKGKKASKITQNSLFGCIRMLLYTIRICSDGIQILFSFIRIQISINEYLTLYLCCMAPKNTPELIERARKNLLEGRYGQFDLIPALIPVSLLLTEKPRQLRRLISSQMEVPLEAVRYRTFISWLARFRARQSLISQPQPRPEHQPAPPITKPIDWKSFQASTPRPRETDAGALISFPTYDA
jgi:hypothetical protein